MTIKLWLNKKEVCERFGGVSYFVIDNLIKNKEFPLPVPLDNDSNMKFYIPSIEEWERKIIKNSIKHNN